MNTYYIKNGKIIGISDEPKPVICDFFISTDKSLNDCAKLDEQLSVEEYKGVLCRYVKFSYYKQVENYRGSVNVDGHTFQTGYPHKEGLTELKNESVKGTIVLADESWNDINGSPVILSLEILTELIDKIETDVFKFKKKVFKWKRSIDSRINNITYVGEVIPGINEVVA